jgi:hypothetical protein
MGHIPLFRSNVCSQEPEQHPSLRVFSPR